MAVPTGGTLAGTSSPVPSPLIEIFALFEYPTRDVINQAPPHPAANVSDRARSSEPIERSSLFVGFSPTELGALNFDR